MTEVTIVDGRLIVEMTGADVLLATRHHLEYPLTHVENAEIVTDVLAESKVGWKMIGGYLPGHFRNGYFREHGTRVFWNVRNFKQTRSSPSISETKIPFASSSLSLTPMQRSL